MFVGKVRECFVQKSLDIILSKSHGFVNTVKIQYLEFWLNNVMMVGLRVAKVQGFMSITFNGEYIFVWIMIIISKVFSATVLFHFCYNWKIIVIPL